MSDNEKRSLLGQIGAAIDAWKGSKQRQGEQRQMSRKELETEIERAMSESQMKKKIYSSDAMTSIDQARRASTAEEKKIYMDELRFHLSLYLYMQNLYTAFLAMQKKLSIQDANQSFVDIVQRFSEIQKSAPKTNDDIRKTTKKALKGMKNDNLGDLSELVSSFVKDTLNYTGSYSFDDTLINDLISGKKKLEDLPGAVKATAGPATVNGSVQTQPIPPNLVEQAMDLETMLGQL